MIKTNSIITEIFFYCFCLLKKKVGYFNIKGENIFLLKSLGVDEGRNCQFSSLALFFPSAMNLTGEVKSTGFFVTFLDKLSR